MGEIDPFYQHDCKVLSVQYFQNLLLFLDENGTIFSQEKNKFKSEISINNAIYFIGVEKLQDNLSEVLLQSTQLMDRKVFFVGCSNGDVFRTTLKEKTNQDKKLIVNIGEKVIKIVQMSSKVLVFGEKGIVNILNLEDGDLVITDFKISKSISNVININDSIIFNTFKGNVYLLETNPLANFLKFLKIPNFQEISMISKCSNDTILVYNKSIGSIQECKIPNFETINKWNEKMIKTEKIQKKIRKRINQIDENTNDQIEMMKKMNQINLDLTSLNKIHQIEMEEKNIICIINEKITHEGKLKITIQNNSKHLLKNWIVKITIKSYQEQDEIIEFKVIYLKPGTQWDTEQPVNLKSYKTFHVYSTLDYPFESGIYSIKLLEKEMVFFQLLEYSNKDIIQSNDQYIFSIKMKLKDGHPLKDFTNSVYYTYLGDPIHLKFTDKNTVTFSSHVYKALLWMRSYLLNNSIQASNEEIENHKRNFKGEMMILTDKLKQLNTIEKQIQDSTLKYDIKKFQQERSILIFEIQQFHEKYLKILNK